MTLSDIDYIESLPECVKYKPSDWKKLQKELSNFVVIQHHGKPKLKPLEQMYDYFMQSDISPKMATHAILMTLSGATRRDQVVEYHNGQQHLNLFGVTIGPSSIARKTVTENRSKTLLEGAVVPIIPSNFTPSALFGVMAQYQQGAMIGSEFSGLLKAFHKEHSNELPELMCRIYDCEANITRFTRKYGEEIILEAYIMFYGGTTPFAYKHFIEDYFVQGFLMRFLYCMELSKPNYKPLSISAPNTSDFDKQTSIELLQAIHGSTIKTMNRSGVNVPRAYTQYQQYCDKIVKRSEQDETSILFSYYGRTPEFVLKIAALLELTNQSAFNVAYGLTSPAVALSDNAIELAVKIVRMFEQEFRLLTKKVRISAISEPLKSDRDTIQYVLNIIKSFTIISNPDLIKETNFNRGKLKDITDTLISSNQIKATNKPNLGKRGSPAQLFYVGDSTLGDISPLEAQIGWLRINGLSGEANDLEAVHLKL